MTPSLLIARARKAWAALPARARTFTTAGVVVSASAVAIFLFVGLDGGSARAANSAAPLETLSDVRVIDGNTIENTRTRERFALANADAAEIGQLARCAAERRHGLRTKNTARRIVADGAHIQVRRMGLEDGYERVPALVFVDGADLGSALIEAGLARPVDGAREGWCAPDGNLVGA